VTAGGVADSHGVRPVHLIIKMIKWIRTSKLSIKNSLSAGVGDLFATGHGEYGKLGQGHDLDLYTFRRVSASAASLGFLSSPPTLIYVVPWSEFPIVPSYSHYPQPGGFPSVFGGEGVGLGCGVWRLEFRGWEYGKLGQGHDLDLYTFRRVCASCG